MKYKVGEKVVLNGHHIIVGRKDTVKIDDIEDWDDTKVYVSNKPGRLVFDDKHIDHNKTAELNMKDTVRSEQLAVDAGIDAMASYLNSSIIKPPHYRKGEIDLIESWYQTMPFDGFRWAMKSHIDKYIYRYEQKNGVEDLDKATYFIERLKEKELLQ